MLGALLAFAAPASATTFCVPAFFAGCPDNGTNLADPDLTHAMSTDGSDGAADKVMIDAATLTATASFVASGSDPLEVVGSGTAQTRLTSSSSANIALFRINNRPGTKVSDLTLVVPASFPNSGGNGSAGFIRDAELDQVDINIENSGSNGISSLLGNNVITDSHVYAGEGSYVDRAFSGNGSVPGTTTFVNTTVQDSRYAFVADESGTAIDIQSSKVLGATSAAAWVGSGAVMTIENSLLTTLDTYALTSGTSIGVPGDAVMTVNSSTIANIGDTTSPALDLSAANSSASGDATMNIHNSIISGYPATWGMSQAIGPGLPVATLNIDHSNFLPVAIEDSGGTANVDDPSNINKDPRFVSPQDFRLMPGSPSIDRGDPASTLTVDLAGDKRPVDGDGNGSKRPDQGAYEFQPTCATVPAVCPDTTAPKVSKVKFFSKPNADKTITCRISEKAKLKLIFRPVPKKARKGKKRRTVVITRQVKKGAVKIKLGKSRLKPGRYRLTLIATDKAGNSSRLTKNLNVQQSQTSAKSDFDLAV